MIGTPERAIEPQITSAARRHIRKMLAAAAPLFNSIEAELVQDLRRQGVSVKGIRAVLAVTPAAACRCRTIGNFLRSVGRAGEELAKIGVPPCRIQQALATFESLLGKALLERFEPAREQLRLITALVLNRAYYRAFNAEARLFLDLFQIELKERARLDAEVRRLEAEARRTEEEERRRIGRELHDEAVQNLVLLRLQLELLERGAPPELLPKLREAREVAERTVAELRRIVAALSPALLERLGLREALQRLASRFRAAHPCEMRVRFTGLCDTLEREQQEVVYRVAQESLSNVAKHSRASRVLVSLRISKEKVRLSIRDNGSGFRAEQAEDKRICFGLSGMRERAALLGGMLAIESEPGEGVIVALELPRKSAEGINVQNPSTLN